MTLVSPGKFALEAKRGIVEGAEAPTLFNPGSHAVAARVEGSGKAITKVTHSRFMATWRTHLTVCLGCLVSRLPPSAIPPLVQHLFAYVHDSASDPSL